MSDEIVRYEMVDDVAVLRFDDGKANVISYASLDALGAALDRAEKDEAKAVALFGRPGRFSAGFDLSVMTDGPSSAIDLASGGARLATRIFDSAAPVVFGVTGHALAMGAVLLCTADERIGVDGPFKIGLNEVGIGMALPEFALTLAEDRLSERHLYRATALAQIYDPQGAVDAGYLDTVVESDALEAAVMDRATQLAANLDRRAYVRTKRDLRKATRERLRIGE